MSAVGGFKTLPTMGLPAWVSRPSKNVQVLFIRDDIPSAEVCTMFMRICQDHGLTATRKDNTVTAKLVDGETEMELTMKTGKHPIKGNLIAMEYLTYSKRNIAAGIGVAVVTILAVVLVVAVVAASGKSGGGGGGGGGHHHHGGGGGVWYFGGGGGGGGRRRRHRGSTTYIMPAGSTYMYTPFTGAQPGSAMVAAGQSVQTAHAFKSRDEFFEYFFVNVRNFFWNAGLVRVPDEAALVGDAHKARAITPGELVEGKLRLFDTQTFCVKVPEEACLGLADTLRFDVLTTGADVSVRLKHGSPPSKFTGSTAKGEVVGNGVTAVAVGPGTSPKICPGYWFVRISSKGDVNYKIGGQLYQDTDKLKLNPQVFGSFDSRTVAEDGGEWELVEDDFAAGGGKPAAPEPSAPPVASYDDDDVLSQATNLLQLDVSRLTKEIMMRGGTFPQEQDQMSLAAALFPLLPAAPVPSGPASLPKFDVMTGEPLVTEVVPSAPPVPPTATKAEEAGVAPAEPAGPPDALMCPITCELMTDPVFTGDGFTYERSAIAHWLQDHKTSPMTGLPLPHTNLVANFGLKAVIANYRAENVTSDYPAAAPPPYAPRFDPFTGAQLVA